MTSVRTRQNTRRARQWFALPAFLFAQHAAGLTPLDETITAWTEPDGAAIVKLQGYSIPRAGAVDAHYLLFVVNQGLTPPEIARLQLVATCDAKDAKPSELAHIKTTRARLKDGKFVDYAEEESRPAKMLNLATDKSFTHDPAVIACERVVKEVASKPAGK